MRKLHATLFLLLAIAAVAQSGPLQALKESSARNKQALSHYTWQEQQTMTVKGDVKRTTVSSVKLDAGGQPQKTQVSENEAPDKDIHGPLRKRLKARKVADFKDYMSQVGALAQSYSHPDAEKLEAAMKSGNLAIDKSGGPSALSFTVKNYLKPNDSMLVVYDETKKMITSVQVKTYLDSPDNQVEMDSRFAQLPDGTSHLDRTIVKGMEKDVIITTQNSGYTKH